MSIDTTDLKVSAHRHFRRGTLAADFTLQSTPHQCVSLSEFRGAPAVLTRKQKMFSHFLRAKRTDRKRMHRELAGSERFSSEAQMSL